MSYQAPHLVTPLVSRLTVTIEELLADPSRTKEVALEAIPELLTQLASRVAALKTLEGGLFALMLSRRLTSSDSQHFGSALLTAPDLAKLFGVPESWVREQARLGNLPSVKLGHYVRFRVEEVQHFLAARASHAV
jgi:excisionase family DNA binding protein